MFDPPEFLFFLSYAAATTVKAALLASSGIGARISALRHFKGCRADVYRGYHGGLSCRSSLITRAVITFRVSGIG